MIIDTYLNNTLLLSSQELLRNLKCYLNMCQLSLEELYVLGILNLHKGQLTVKAITRLSSNSHLSFLTNPFKIKHFKIGLTANIG
jgi:hypothetical protein